MSKRARQQSRAARSGPAASAPVVQQVIVEPRALKRLSPEARAACDRLMATAVEFQRLEAQRDRLVARLRASGAPWSVIGWAVGTTGEGARQKYGRDEA